MSDKTVTMNDLMDGCRIMARSSSVALDRNAITVETADLTDSNRLLAILERMHEFGKTLNAFDQLAADARTITSG